MFKHSVPKEMIESIDYLPEGSGEAGWMIYLKDGFSFDPRAKDGCRWIPEDSQAEAMQLIAHKINQANIINHEYLVTYINRHFCGSRVVLANSKEEAKAMMESEGYRVTEVAEALDDE